MASTFSLRTFIRIVTKKQIHKYFNARKLLADFKWSLEGDEFVEALDAEIENAGGNIATLVENDFGMISEFADEPGILSLIEIINTLNNEEKAEEILKKLMLQSGMHEKALWVFINHPTVIEWALRLEHMKSMQFKHDCLVGVDLECKTDRESVDKLRDKIQKFYKKQNRGRNCQIDTYVRQDPERYCFFAYPEDYAKRDLTYDENKLTSKIRRPVLEIVFIYDPGKGILKISAGRMRKVEVMQKAFCQEILGLPGIPDGSTKVYNLAPLMDSKFRFITDPEDEIESVSLKMVKAMVRRDQRKRRFTFEGEPEKGGTELVRKMLMDSIEKFGIKLSQIKVLQAKIAVKFKTIKGQKQRSVTFYLTSAGGSTLEDKPTHHIANGYLSEWNLVETLLPKDEKVA